MKTTTKIIIALIVMGIIISAFLIRGCQHSEPKTNTWQPIDTTRQHEAKVKADSAERDYEKAHSNYLSPVDSVRRDSLRARIWREATKGI